MSTLWDSHRGSVLQGLKPVCNCLQLSWNSATFLTVCNCLYRLQLSWQSATVWIGHGFCLHSYYLGRPGYTAKVKRQRWKKTQRCNQWLRKICVAWLKCMQNVALLFLSNVNCCDLGKFWHIFFIIHKFFVRYLNIWQYIFFGQFTCFFWLK